MSQSRKQNSLMELYKIAKEYEDKTENFKILKTVIKDIDIFYVLQDNEKLKFDNQDLHKCIANIQFVIVDEESLDSFESEDSLDSEKIKQCYITSINVTKTCRHKGIGTLLFKEVQKECIKHNVKIIKLDSMTKNDDEHNLFIKCGMKYVNKSHGPEMIMYL
jgi:N-acetylglutamate synthase-like GNAT family acetyltransferase